MKKLSICILGLSLAVGLTFLDLPNISAQPMELKAVSFLPKDNTLNTMIPVWIDRVNTELKSVLRVNWVGGPEVIAPFDQAEAVRKNLMQVGFIPAAYYTGLLPEADIISLSKYDFKKERERGGLFDYFVERHKTINLRLIGTYIYEPFYLVVRKPVSKLEDLKGLKMRTAAKYDKMMLKLGMIPVTIQMGETYTGLQRGVVDGFGFSTIGPREYGWLENCKYVIDIPFYMRQNTYILMNLDVWNKLPKEAQDKIMDITIKFEPEMKAAFEKMIQNEKKRWRNWE
jgi:TRAP-type C4-dicarboxylate transport system substrate-binding protein